MKNELERTIENEPQRLQLLRKSRHMDSNPNGEGESFWQNGWYFERNGDGRYHNLHAEAAIEIYELDPKLLTDELLQAYAKPDPKQPFPDLPPEVVDRQVEAQYERMGCKQL